ncbi:cell wall-binding repeat-containing protein [Haloimpatiens sp. FM7315]|uniref:cell wall-binding repeat-containing protein n=1 Tax=Haloimpatiens sp. FM7315 TaxID=3298609 RepID=UPI0039775041
MKNNTKNTIFAISFFLFFCILNKNALALPNVIRFSGSDRYETCANISKNNWDKADTAILVSGQSFPDSLCAVALSKKFSAPILLSYKEWIPKPILEEIKRLQVKEIILIGGQGVLSTNIEESLKKLGISFKRIGGKDRYETSLEIAKIIGTDNGIAIVSGENYPDALSIAPIAAYKEMPLILTTKTSFKGNTYQYLKEKVLDKCYVIGGQAVIGDYVNNISINICRLSGSDRYKTNLSVINYFIHDISMKNLYFTTGNDFPDALSGASAAGRENSVLVLTYNYGTVAKDLIHENINEIENVKILGGEQAVSNYSINKVIYGRSTSKLITAYSTCYEGDKSSYNSLIKNSSIIDQVSLFAYTVDINGDIFGAAPLDQMNYALNNGVESLAMIGNEFDSNIAKSILGDVKRKENFINNIFNILEKNNYKGISLDIEGVKYSDRNNFTVFLKELYNKLNSSGYKVVVSVPAKTKDVLTDSWSGAYDYKEISKYCDYVAIMAYDEHYLGGDPGPVASIGWVNNVLNYAIDVIPKEKILLGVASYGYDWSENGNKAYSLTGAYSVASKFGSNIKWDDTNKCPYFTYKDNGGYLHTVWLENESSLKYKLDLVNGYDLCGIAIWRLGLENEEYWNSIKSKFN